MRNKVSSITSVVINDWIPLLLPSNSKREKHSEFAFSSKSNYYLRVMFYVNNYLEDEESKLFHALPLKNSCNPSYSRINKTNLLNMFFVEFKDVVGQKSSYRCNNQAADLMLWNTFLKMNNQICSDRIYTHSKHTSTKKKDGEETDPDPTYPFKKKEVEREDEVPPSSDEKKTTRTDLVIFSLKRKEETDDVTRTDLVPPPLKKKGLSTEATRTPSAPSPLPNIESVSKNNG
ncbi:hypothetical protein P9112_007838 [Eukaryota sp. TZLM1-RC]